MSHAEVEPAQAAGALLTTSGAWKTLAGVFPWDAQWQAAKAAAREGKGVARVAVIGDSYVAGQSSGVVTDCLRYGFVGRLNTWLAGLLGVYADGYTIASVAPGNLTSPSGPYTVAGSYTAYDGGIGQAWAPSTTGGTWLTIKCPLHPVTGAAPTKIDLLTIDFNANKWSYQLDEAAPVEVTCEGNGVVGHGILRRTSIALSGSGAHEVKLSNLGANGLVFVGHVTYYGEHGLGIMRNGIPGFRAIDFATGGGETASSSGGMSLTPDHIIPWAGLHSSSTPANANITAAAAEGFPFNGVDLAIIHLLGNDATYGGAVEAARKALTRKIHAYRRPNPATSESPGTSIVLLSPPYFSEYSDNPATGAVGYEWQRYKQIARDLALEYNCGWWDLETVFGETPVARGLVEAGQVHPTQSTAANWGTDGHSEIGKSIEGIL